MNSIVELAEIGECTGCGLCASVCPRHCIEMGEGNHGHLFPRISNNMCIKCGLCENSCTVLHPSELKPILKSFVSWTKDVDDYKTTSSGGIATTLAKYVINHDGIVYGCAMLPDVEVKHIRVDSVDKIDLLKSSKYVQSSLMEIFPNVKADVSSGRMVLFIGTPCQVAAIKIMFPSVPDNLFLVDLICHGVPSLQTLKEHVKKVARGKKVAKVLFRESGNLYVFVVYDVEGGLLYKMPLWQKRYRDWYMNSFIDGYTFRESCYQCRFARPERVSDMTIGDFWGLKDDVAKIPSHKYGCSVVLPITCKGLMLIEEIKPLVNLYERDVQEAIAGNSQLRHPTKLTKRIRFYRKVQIVLKSPRMYYLVNLDRIISYILAKLRKES